MMFEAMVGLMTFIAMGIWLGMVGIGIYVLVLVIKALKIYISKNS